MARLTSVIIIKFPLLLKLFLKATEIYTLSREQSKINSRRQRNVEL